MPYTLKKNKFKYKNPDTGNYEGVDVVAERSFADYQSALENVGLQQQTVVRSEGTTQKNAVTAAGTAAVANFPATAAACDTLAGDFAATYVPDQAYAVGDYCTYQYQLYQCKTAIAINTDHTFVASHWNLITVTDTINDQVDDLKTQLNDVESLVELNAGNKILDTWIPSSYYRLTSSVITVDINDPEESGGWQCMYVACQQGDVFYLTTTGTSTARPYAFLSSANGENNIITKAGSNDTVFENYKLIAPAGSAYAIFNSLVSEKSSVIKGELGKDAGWTFTNVNIPFEIGNISFSTDGPTYKYDRYSRARTPQGYSLYLHDGDVVGLTDYTNARYYIAWWDDSNVFHYSSAESADRKITQNGKYIFLLRNATEVSLFDNLSSLTNLFFAKIKTDANQLYSESCGYGERYVQKDASGLNYHLFNHASPKFAMHRGCSTLAPENTAPAFNLAGENGAWGIETDVFETTDGYFVCHHDSTVDRMTDGTGNITSMSLSQVEALTIDAGANIEEYPNLKIPRLETFLSICRRYGCVGLIEIKTVTNYQNLINVIRKAGMENSVLFLVATYPLVPIVKYYTKAPVALIGYDTSINADLISTVDTFVNACVDVYASLVIDDTDIIKAHTYNVPFMAWVVDDESRADELFRLGVDVITSNAICNLTN